MEVHRLKPHSVLRLRPSWPRSGKEGNDMLNLRFVWLRILGWFQPTYFVKGDGSTITTYKRVRGRITEMSRVTDTEIRRVSTGISHDDFTTFDLVDTKKRPKGGDKP